MAELIPGDFGTYNLSEQEEMQARIIQPMMKYFLQNELSAAASELVSLRLGGTSQEYKEELQVKVVYLQARMDFIKELFISDANATKELENRRQQFAAAQEYHPDQGNVMRVFSDSRQQPQDPSNNFNQAVDFNRPSN